MRFGHISFVVPGRAAARPVRKKGSNMTRSMVAAAALCSTLALALQTEGCKQTGVGDPCTPEQEYDTTFAYFAASEVYVESKSFQCQTRLCLVNHFQGRTTCPYGQISTKTPYAPAKACLTPGSASDVVGEVKAQCEERRADKTVYCSCRCANINGATDDGANYCECPDGFDCRQLVTSIGCGDTGLTGSYCIKTGSVYDNKCDTKCDPVKKNCGTQQLE